MNFYKTPHAILILKEQRDEYMSEYYTLERVDAVKSAKRILELKHFMDDLDKAIEALESIGRVKC